MNENVGGSSPEGLHSELVEKKQMMLTALHTIETEGADRLEKRDSLKSTLPKDSRAKTDARAEEYHGIFMSHTGADKPFVRQLSKDLLARSVPRVWVDEAEIEIGDSLIKKIEEGMKETRYIGVVLSSKSVKAPWVMKELDVAMNREIAGGEVVVLPLLYERCELPEFLKGKLYADFTSTEAYDAALANLLRRLRVR